MQNAIEQLNSNICPVCHLQSEKSLYRNPTHTRTVQLRCERCGTFDITIEALMTVGQIDDAARPIISGWISDQNRMGAIPLLRDDLLDQLSKTPPLRFSEKARRLLEYAAEITLNLGQDIRLLMPAIASRVQTFEETDIRYIARYLEEHGWLKITQQAPELFALTGDGLIKTEEWQVAGAKSSQGFVAMWFHPSLSEAWLKGFYLAIEGAGYVPMRIDTKEHANKICDEVITEIRRSRFMVADFTGQRNGVYYEAGFAAALPIRVIWTCRKDDLANLHFDIRQYNCIDWEKPDELCERLRSRIVALIGDGPRKSPMRLPSNKVKR